LAELEKEYIMINALPCKCDSYSITFPSLFKNEREMLASRLTQAANGTSS